MRMPAAATSALFFIVMIVYISSDRYPLFQRHVRSIVDVQSPEKPTRSGPTPAARRGGSAHNVLSGKRWFFRRGEGNSNSSRHLHTGHDLYLFNLLCPFAPSHHDLFADHQEHPVGVDDVGEEGSSGEVLC